MGKPQNLPHVCFIGTGRMALAHAKSLRSLFPRIKISFASRDAVKADEISRKIKGSNAFSSYEQAIQSPDVDIVFIVTPHAYHSEIGKMAAMAGKHIILEKPATRTMSEWASLMRIVDRKKVRLTVAENYYYKPAYNRIARYVAEGLIGTPMLLELNKTGYQKVSGWRANAEMMGGGALLEGGIHWVDALYTLLPSEPKQVIAHKPLVNYDSNVPFEDTLMLGIDYQDGSIAKLTHSWRLPNRWFGLSKSKLYGTEGVITFESNGLWVSCRGKKNRFYVPNPAGFLGFKQMLKTLIEDFCADRPWQPGTDRIEKELRLVHAAYHSLHTRKMEKI